MCSAGTGWSLGMFFCCPFHTRLTNRYAPILINTSVHTGRVMPCILLTLYTHEHNPKHIFTLEVYFLSFNACNYSDCVLGAKGCQSAGGLHSVLWLNASLWTLMENWSCCCCSANLLLKLLLLCRHSVNLTPTRQLSISPINPTMYMFLYVLLLLLLLFCVFICSTTEQFLPWRQQWPWSWRTLRWPGQGRSCGTVCDVLCRAASAYCLSQCAEHFRLCCRLYYFDWLWWTTVLQFTHPDDQISLCSAALHIFTRLPV